jgi:ABC-type multidrug transport system fused ATPase/permease subunit
MYEVLAVVGVSGAIVISLARGTGGEQFFELLTLMAISAYRIMPTMSRINGVMMAMSRNMYALGAMERGLGAVLESSSQMELNTLELDSRPTISLQGLTLGYTSLPEPVLTGLNHVFEPGRIHAIVGASGSGKSTLVNAMLGLHPLDAGNIQISDGRDEWGLGKTCTKESWLAELGYLSQQPFFFAGTVRDNLTFRAPGREVDEPLIDDLIARLGLQSCLGELPLEFQLNEAGTNLSGGQQQRLALLRSLQIPTKVLLLDEATSALDVDSRDKVFGLLRERAEAGTLIIIITHDRELAGMCDEVLDLES